MILLWKCIGNNFTKKYIENNFSIKCVGNNLTIEMYQKLLYYKNALGIILL